MKLGERKSTTSKTRTSSVGVMACKKQQDVDS